MILASASDVFNRVFYGSMPSEDIIEIKDVSQEAFLVIVEIIYNKKPNLKAHNLRFLASLYYLADKYNVKNIRDNIIASISDIAVNKGNFVDVALLAEETVQHKAFSDVLYEALVPAVDSFTKVVVMCADVGETHGPTIFKILRRIGGNVKTGKLKCVGCLQSLLNCKDGDGLTPQNFIKGAQVRNTNSRFDVGLVVLAENNDHGGTFSASRVGWDNWDRKEILGITHDDLKFGYNEDF